MKISAVFLVLFLSSFHFSIAQDSLKLLTWNVQMLPNLVKAGGKAKRAKAIVNQLKTTDYDAIIFQEVFHTRSRRIITKGLASLYPFRTPVLNRKTISLKTNGGVMIISKFRINETHEIRYTSRTGFDKMSRKGAMLAEIDFKGKPVQLVGTHLQAFGTEDVMYSQYQQLADQLLKLHAKPTVPQFVCGDFNTLKTIPPKLPDNISQDFINRLPRYHFLLKTLDVVDGDLAGNQQFTMDRPYNDMCKSRKEYRLLLDYVLLRDNGTNCNVRREVKIFRQSWHKEHADLSDHFAVEAIVIGL